MEATSNYKPNQFSCYASLVTVPIFTAQDNPYPKVFIAAHDEFLRAFPEEERIRISKTPHIVQKLFPSVSSWNSIVAMAYWLSYSLAFTSRLRTATENSTLYGLFEILKIFHENGPILEDGQMSSHAGDVWSQSAMLRDFMISLLPLEIVRVVFRRIREVIMAYIEEHLFSSASSYILKDYLVIRCKTIGLEPCFAILGLDTAHIPLKTSDFLLDHLKTLVNIAIVLQSDLAGLQRDIDHVDSKNIILAPSRSERKATGSRKREIHDYFGEIMGTIWHHNRAHSLAIRFLEKIEKIGSLKEKQQARVLYKLFGTHWHWRYQQEDSIHVPK
ncbi:uncharacterized protein PV06_11533 [Exophiala oligosperma]|uniref:Terpene synthase n=1 Tax=Exophiala oligosperma TaxID=215243 RepID=A0A0D2DKA0_9EURO|nr:uncharacterized protein PV06_11533 [Exophiala oligosperma]KIW36169.1 hypothetical protein PV06_11533 [Exophiala oligosperma]